MKPEVHRLRVNVKSLAAEAKIIRDEMKRADTKEAREQLHTHRMLRVRPEARLAHLALAFVRGRTYKEAEASARELPDAIKLADKISRFVYQRDIKMQVGDWIRA